ncbi:mechanosensitive ion channel family protein [Granulicella cerasi]|uniref:Mechanosensitive ion channel family protein n=1 Tax=Granulicella cerasi TaxID=741063 RepID=A0ABW1Z7S1_9BACT|nr:mechanosensitive ion channel family protein [Granulicella cerasi]
MLGIHFQHRWFLVLFVFCAAIVLANVVHYVLFRLLRRKEAQSVGLGLGIQTHLGRPARVIFLLSCVSITLPLLPAMPDKIEASIHHGLLMATVVSVGWFAVGCVYVLERLFLRKFDLNAQNNVRARRMHTQFQVFRRTAIGLVIVLTAGALLWTFKNPRIWQYGSGLLASAGVASLLLATAAKSTASNFLAGMQIAMTEPIRLDDVVIVQGEWGRIEEITTTYVVVKIWDLRRLIVPLSYFIENTFQNWTRESSDIMGTAFLYVDYTVSVDALREELERVVRASPLWDGKVLGLQVTNLSERTMELRCLMSSTDSSKNFDLRCDVREKMIAFVRERFPEAFPTMRVRSDAEKAADAAALSN